MRASFSPCFLTVSWNTDMTVLGGRLAGLVLSDEMRISISSAAEVIQYLPRAGNSAEASADMGWGGGVSRREVRTLWGSL